MYTNASKQNNILFSNSRSSHYPPHFLCFFCLIMIVIDCTQKGLSFFIIFRFPTSLSLPSAIKTISVPSVRREFARHRITRCSESLYFTSHPNVFRFALFESSQPRPVAVRPPDTHNIQSTKQEKAHYQCRRNAPSSLQSALDLATPLKEAKEGRTSESAHNTDF